MKTILIPVKIPDQLNYLAVQPYGDIVLFPAQPEIYDNKKWGEYYWAQQDGEKSLFEPGFEAENEPADWKKTVRHVVTIEQKAKQIAEKIAANLLLDRAVAETIMGIVKQELDNSPE